MAESITVGLISAQDLSFGHGTFSQTILDGTSVTLNKINLSYLYNPYTVTFSATPTFDLVNGVTQTMTLTSNVTSSTISQSSGTLATGTRLVLRLVQDGTGGRTFAWPSNVSGSGSFSISTTASAVTRAELQYNGTNWEFVSIPLVVSAGTITGSVLTGAGTATYLPKYTAATTLGISDVTDNGSGLLLFKYNSAGDTKLWVANETNGAASRSVLYVGGNPSSADNIDIELISQKSGNTTSSWDLSGVVRTGSGSTSGLILSSSAGPIRFQPAGTTTKVAIFLSTTGASTQYNLEVGTTAASASDSQPIYASRSQNGSTDVTAINATSGTTARTAFRAVAGGGSSPDLYCAVTSAAYTTAGGITASTGFIYTGAGTTGGLIVQTTSGNFILQIGGSTTVTTFTSAEIRQTGRIRAFTLLQARPTSGTSVDICCAEAPGLAGVIAAATWGANDGATVMTPINLGGSTVEVFTGASYSALTSRMTIGPGVQVGAPAGGDKGAGTINVAADIYKNNTAYTNPDFVFEHYFTGAVKEHIANDGAVYYKGLMPFKDVIAHAKASFQLPNVARAQGIFARADAALLHIESLYLYISELETRLSNLEKV